MPKPRWRHILVATDGSAGSLVAAERALELASQCAARVTAVVVHPADRYQALATRGRAVPREVARFVSRACAAGLAAETRIAGGDPGPQILATARAIGADLIVIGRHGWPFDAEPPTVTSGYLLNHSDLPVLVVQPWATIGGLPSSD